LLYEVLTGTNPQSRPEVSMEEAMRLVLEQDPPPPSRIAGIVPHDLDAVTLKALAKAPADRYQSVSELDADLARWLDGRPVTAVPPRPWYVFSRWVRRHQVAAATAALAMTGIVAALGVALVQYRQAEHARAVAEARFTQVRRLANSLIFQLDDVVRTKSTTEARQLIVADALQYLDRLMSSSSDPALQLELAQGYRRVAEIQGDPNVANLGNREGAHDSARKALAILESLAQDPAAGLEKEAALEALVSTNRLLSTLVPKTEGLAYTRAALAAAERRLDVNRTDEARVALASARFSMAALLEPVGMRQQYEAAGREFESLLAERPDDPKRMRNVALVDKNLTQLLADAGETTEARQRAERAAALDARRVALNPADRQARLDAAISYAQLAGRLDDVRARLEQYEKSMRLREQVALEDPSNRLSRLLFRRALAQVARTRLEAGDAAGARDAALRFLDGFVDDTDGPTAMTERHWRGWAYLVAATTDGQRGRPVQGCARLALALDDFETSGRPSPKAAIAVASAALPGCAAAADGRLDSP
jgi:eukaryotic-like serine/threonine-protein kinase